MKLYNFMECCGINDDEFIQILKESMDKTIKEGIKKGSIYSTIFSKKDLLKEWEEHYKKIENINYEIVDFEEFLNNHEY